MPVTVPLFRFFRINHYTAKLKTMKSYELFEEIEMPLGSTLYRMEQEGIYVKREALRQYSEKLGERIDVLEQDVSLILPGKNLISIRRNDLARFCLKNSGCHMERKRRPGIRLQQKCWRNCDLKARL